jgi:hypothetical protein
MLFADHECGGAALTEMLFQALDQCRWHLALVHVGLEMLGLGGGIHGGSGSGGAADAVYAG